jgi:hypothetical protein
LFAVADQKAAFSGLDAPEHPPAAPLGPGDAAAVGDAAGVALAAAGVADAPAGVALGAAVGAAVGGGVITIRIGVWLTVGAGVAVV